MMTSNSVTATRNTVASPDDLLTDLEAAELLHASPSVLRNWRWAHIGPRFHKIGTRMVRYRRDDLQAFIEAGAHGTVQTPRVPT